MMADADGTPGRQLDARILLVFALPLAAFLLRLGGAPLFDVDEGAFSEATREMFERGDFSSTYLNGAHRFDKPILIYWLQAASYWCFSGALDVEWIFRLPSALAAMAWCYAAWHFARHRFGPETALAALAVIATALGPFIIGRAATADALLNLFLALALFDAWRYFESRGRAPLLRCYVWIGLGALTKGPIALIVPGAVTFLYCISRKEWRLWLHALGDVRGWLIFAALTVPWYGTALAIHGQSFIDGFILKHNVERFTGTLEGHAGSLFYYIIFVPLLLLPWTGPFIASLRQIKADFTASGLRRYLWIWAGFVIVFFSLSGTKLPHYALYGTTPLFLLIAAHRDELRRPLAHLAASGIFLALLVCLPVICTILTTSDIGNAILVATGMDNAYYRDQLAEAGFRAGAAYYVICGAALFLWLATAFARRGALWNRLLTVAILQTLVLALVFAPWLGAVLQGPVKEAAIFVRERPEPVVAWKLTLPSISVYRDAVTPSRPPEAGEVAITHIGQALEPGFETLFRRGSITVVRKPAAIADPDSRGGSMTGETAP
ncbi:MAG: glycosyltransferase family 39 protein [Azoarcus sp.]|jgi:4-amino-4-deoxy-L-arabinose transferase-like glycosyltransferase|nr:glycosyltransferase family 39 protein [Azoarcus sp.]